MQSDLKLAISAARAAGEVIMSYYEDEYDIKEKGGDERGGNPVTTADLEADNILKRLLLENRPDYGWLSEETADSGERLKCDRVWIVDPIDGTKEFIKGIPQFAISIGLADQGEIILAVILNPAKDEMYAAVRDEGITLNGKPVGVTEQSALKGASVLASRSEVARGEFDDFKDEFEITPIGSIAYKLAMVASGQADLTFTLTPKNEWDFAAGYLLVGEAGGHVQVLGGHPQRFNQEDPLVQGVVATNTALFEPLMARLSDKV
ncbi:MAG: 3'(2'),5'-bisphosphate nucleotidase CysQ [Leptospirillia bacterium]